MSRKTWLFLAFFTFLTIISHFYKVDKVPMCFNSDEAAFAYNSYSILKTGRDEYGKFLPSRFLSFGENKLPVVEYVSVPFLQAVGLNETAARLPIILVGILFPILMFFFVKEFTENESVALIAAFLTSLSPWIQTMTRHIHEVGLVSSLIILSLLFFIKYLKGLKWSYFILFSVFNGLALFTYHSAKVFTLFFFVWMLLLVWRHKNFRGILGKALPLIIFLIPVLLFQVTDWIHPTTRIGKLLFYNNEGLMLSIKELQTEQASPLIHNVWSQSAIFLTDQYLTYFSPEFLVITGGTDPRFGFKGISPITAIEYVFIFIGLYYLFKNKFRYRYLLIALMVISPFTAVATWLEPSLTRSFFLIVPIIIIVSYGVCSLLMALAKNKFRTHVALAILLIFLILNFYSWDFYFFHYPQRAYALRSWQCGYKELSDYVKTNYNRFDKFYITRKYGQPYIFLLFYMQYPPELYQKQAHLSAPDKYGFGQVERFDKFDFNFKFDPALKNTVFIGFPDDFNNLKIDPNKLKKIKVSSEEIFWIWENP